MRKLQLEDLSKKLGVSKTLISMVLNGKGNQYGISKKTQARVLDAISELNYSPNKFAKSLRTGKSYFIGLIVTDISNPFYSTIAKNIENLLFESEYNLMVCSTDENEDKEKKLVETMVNQQGVDGLIIATTFRDSSFYSQPRFQNIPIVFIDRIIPMFPANYVVTDNFGGAEKIVGQLIAEGCSKIACLAITPLYLSTIAERIAGYRSAIKTGKKKGDLLRAVHFDSIHEDVERCLAEFSTMKTPPDAIFALNNHIAVALLSALRKPEFRQLGQVKVACFDDIETFDIVQRRVISVSQPVEQIGKNSCSLLLELVSGARRVKSNVVLPIELVLR